LGVEVREQMGNGMGTAGMVADREDPEAAGRERDAKEGLAFGRGERRPRRAISSRRLIGGKEPGRDAIGDVRTWGKASGFGVAQQHRGFGWGCLEMVERVGK